MNGEFLRRIEGVGAGFLRSK